MGAGRGVGKNVRDGACAGSRFHVIALDEHFRAIPARRRSQIARNSPRGRLPRFPTQPQFRALANVRAMIETGTKAPDFTLPDQDGNEVSLTDLGGKTVVLYFYPRADTGINSVGLT